MQNWRKISERESNFNYNFTLNVYLPYNCCKSVGAN